MKNLPALIALSTLLLLQSACQKKQQEAVIPEPKFVSVYAKLTTASVTAHPVFIDSLGPARMVDSILATEGVTRQQFNATVAWYNKDVQRWKPFLDEVVKALEDSVKANQNSGKPW